MDDVRQPWWQVTGVFDPDGTGSDFSYTEGLAEEDLPELHLWARPTLGDDPGLDWKLSPRDTARVLNELAWRLVDGRLKVGDSWEETYDEGFVRVRFSVHPPVSSDEVDAFGAGDAPVLPIKWELVRDPIGAPQPMSVADRAAAEKTYEELIDHLDLSRPAPPGWELPTEPSWDEGQRFGPRTPLVLARAALLWQATTEDVVDLLARALVCHRFGTAGYARLVSRAAARAPGRQSAVEEVEAGAHALVEGFGPHAREVLLDAVIAYLAVEVVADLLPVRIQTWGQGAVLTGLGPAGLPPDPRWECSPTVAEAVARVVTTTPAADLIAAAEAWDEWAAGEGCQELMALLWTGSSHAPSVSDLLEQAAFVTAGLQQWANALATVLTYRPMLDADVVDTFVSAGRRIPGLAALVNAPLVAAR